MDKGEWFYLKTWTDVAVRYKFAEQGRKCIKFQCNIQAAITMYEGPCRHLCETCWLSFINIYECVPITLKEYENTPCKV